MGPAYLLASSDWIIALEAGKISEQGTHSQLKTAGGYVQSLVKELRLSSSTPEETADVKVIEIAKKQYKSTEAMDNNDQRRQLGDRTVYKYYYSSIGFTYTLTLIMLELVWAFLESFPSRC